MAAPLELDASDLTGSDGRDLLRLRVSSDNTAATILVAGASAGMLGVQIWDEAHSTRGMLLAYRGDFNGDIVVGAADPGGSAKMRVQGRARFSVDAATPRDSEMVTIRANPDTTSALFFDSTNVDYASWIVGMGAGDGEDAFNWYNYTDSGVRMRIRATGQVDILEALVVGPDPGGSNRLRVGGSLYINPGQITVAPNVSNGVNVGAIFLSNSYGLSLAGTQDNGASSSIFHNADAYYNSGGPATLKWRVTHSTFGSRGIWFDYTGGGAGMPGAGGIAFYADNASATAGSSFTPTLRLVIQNDGPVVAYGPSLTVLRSGADPSLEVRRLGTASALMVVGGVDYVGTNSDSALKPYARIRAIAESHISLAEYGRLYFYVMVNGTEQNMMEVRDTGLWLKNTTTLLYTAGMTNFAGANTGTLTNAPAAGNPTKWIQINDGGVLRKIPTW